MEDEALLVLEGATEPSGHRELREGVVAAEGVDEIAVAPVVLGLVHGCVRVLEQGRAVGGVERVEADADAGAHEDLDPGDDERVAQGAPDPPRDGFGRVADAVDRVLSRGLGRDEEEELVAAVAGDCLARARRGAQAPGDRGQELVSGLVTEAVVDQLEVVEVDEEDPDCARLRAADRLFEAPLERDAVGKPGEGVVIGDVLELASRPRQRVGGVLALGDVDDDAVHVPAPVLGPPGMHAVPHPARLPVVADQPVLELERRAALDRLVAGVVGGPVVRVDGVLPGLFGRAVVRKRPEQALEAGADERGADVGAVRLHLHLVNVHGDRPRHSANDVARVGRAVVVAGIWHGASRRRHCRHRHERLES